MSPTPKYKGGKTVLIVQARTGSSRLPGKMLLPVRGLPLIDWVLRRACSSRAVDVVVLATTALARDDALAARARALGTAVFRGDEDDVLGRFAQAARELEAGLVVRVCADNPFVDPAEIDRLVAYHRRRLAEGADPTRLYAFNHVPDPLQDPWRYADGLGAESLCAELLAVLDRDCNDPRAREHVTWGARHDRRDCLVESFPAPPLLARPEVRLDVDTAADLQGLRRVALALGPDGIDASGARVLAAWDRVFGAGGKREAGI